jgi:hypothetical protein
LWALVRSCSLERKLGSVDSGRRGLLLRRILRWLRLGPAPKATPSRARPKLVPMARPKVAPKAMVFRVALLLAILVAFPSGCGLQTLTIRGSGRTLAIFFAPVPSNVARSQLFLEIRASPPLAQKVGSEWAPGLRTFENSFSPAFRLRPARARANVRRRRERLEARGQYRRR